MYESFQPVIVALSEVDSSMVLPPSICQGPLPTRIANPSVWLLPVLSVMAVSVPDHA